MKYENLKDWKYRVTKPFNLQTDIIPPQEIRTNFSTLTTEGRLYIHKGFCWNGPNGAFETKNLMLYSCVLDAGYSWFFKGLITEEMRGQFDDLFYKFIKQDDLNDLELSMFIKL